VSLVTVVVPTAVQPLAAVTVTEYGPAVLTVMEGVVAPVLHRYVTGTSGCSVIVTEVSVQFSGPVLLTVTFGATRFS
jgi:hypothetical protein